jgi:hypothetical protein
MQATFGQMRLNETNDIGRIDQSDPLLALRVVLLYICLVVNLNFWTSSLCRI